MQTSYPATFTAQAEGGYFVSFPDLPDTFTEGATLEEAHFNAAEVLSAMVGWHLDEGHTIPTPSIIDGAEYIAPDAKTQAVLLLRNARGNRSLSDLARAMETSWPQVQRLDNHTYWPSLRTLDRAARVLGKRLVLQMV